MQPTPGGPQATVTINVTLQQGKITLSPVPSGFQGDTVVKFRIHSIDLEHGFRLVAPSGVTLTLDRTYKPDDGIIEQTIKLTGEGTYAYLCTNTSCSTLHNSMYGTFAVGNESPYEPPGY